VASALLPADHCTEAKTGLWFAARVGSQAAAGALACGAERLVERRAEEPVERRQVGEAGDDALCALTPRSGFETVSTAEGQARSRSRSSRTP